jgi:hypothetical protein
MDQHEHDTEYEAPVVEDLIVDHAPASVAAGVQQTPAN